MVVNKCNITKYALNRVAQLQFGINCENVTDAIIENYLVYLGCGGSICYPDDCSNPVIYFKCRFRVLGITRTIPSDNNVYDIQFSATGANLFKGEEPYTYEWSFDADDFEVVGSATGSSINLKLKEGKQLNLLVTSIGVTVEDGNSCQDSKTCWLVNSAMQCADNYVPCANPQILEVTPRYIICPEPETLEVTPNY